MKRAAIGLTDRGLAVDLLYLPSLRSPAGLLRARSHIRALARGYEVIHSQYGSAVSLVSATGRHGRPIVVSLRGSDWTGGHSRALTDAAYDRMARRMTRAALRHAAVVVAVSQRMADEIRREYPHRHTVVIPSPVDLDAFKPRDRTAARLRLGLDVDCTYVLFSSINRDNPTKRVELAHQAMSYVRRRRRDVRLLVASGVEPDQMPLWVAASDVALLCSVAEGWPNSIKEALACNVPFVATDVSDLHRIAAHEPSCHVVPADGAALGNALLDVLASGRPSTLRKHVLEMALPATADRLIALYQSLV